MDKEQEILNLFAGIRYWRGVLSNEEKILDKEEKRLGNKLDDSPCRELDHAHCATAEELCEVKIVLDKLSDLKKFIKCSYARKTKKP